MFRTDDWQFAPSRLPTALTPEEILLVSGGDDGAASCGPGDGDDCAPSDSGVAQGGTLATVTVEATAENPIGDEQAENLVNNIDTAFESPAIALAFFVGTIMNWFANRGPSDPNPPPPSIGNPMGDPSPGGP